MPTIWICKYTLHRPRGKDLIKGPPGPPSFSIFYFPPPPARFDPLRPPTLRVINLAPPERATTSDAARPPSHHRTLAKTMTTAPTAICYPMSNESMHAFLKASCGVETCDIKAQALFDAATSSTPAVWHVFLVISRVTDVRAHGVEGPSYLPTEGQQSRPRAPTYPPTPPLLHWGELCNVNKDQTLQDLPLRRSERLTHESESSSRVRNRLVRRRNRGSQRPVSHA